MYMGKSKPDSMSRRRLRWWIVPVAAIVIGVGALLIWLFRPRIERAFERPATLPPPPPTAVGDTGGAQPDGVLYAANFDDEAQAADWNLFDDGIISARLSGGMLVVDVNALENKGAWSGLNYTFEDFVLDVDATKLGGPDDNGIVIVFRLTDEGNYNRFDISSDGYYTLTMVRGGLSRTVSDYNLSEAILMGEATNHIQVRAVGDAFSFAVNGQALRLCVSEDAAVQPLWDPSTGECLGGEIVDEWRNGDLPRGRIGLGAQGFTGFDGEMDTPALATIGFDNLVISMP